MNDVSWLKSLPKYHQRQFKARGYDKIFGINVEAGEDRKSRVSRRGFLKGAGAAMGAAAAAGGAGLWPGRARAACTMNFMTWEGYDDPRIVEPFEKENNCTLKAELIVDDPGAMAKLVAGGHRDFDVAILDSPWNLRFGPAGLCEFLNYEDFEEEYDNMYPQFAHPFTPLMWEDKITGLPTRWGWVAVPLNLNYSTIEEWQSYAPCFDPANKDKIGIMDWGDWPILPMAFYAGINPYKELDRAEINEMREVLRALFKNTRALFADLTLAQKALIDGSVKTLLGTGTYTTSGARLEGHTEVLTIVPPPKDGIKQGTVWLEAMSIVKEPNEPEIAKKFIKHIASTEVSYILSLTELTANVTPNKRVEELYTAEEREILQADDMWDAWENCYFHDIAPNTDELLAVFQEELSRAA